MRAKCAIKLVLRERGKNYDGIVTLLKTVSEIITHPIVGRSSCTVERYVVPVGLCGCMQCMLLLPLHEVREKRSKLNIAA